MGVSLNGGTPKTPQNDHFLVGKPHGCWGNPPFKETPKKQQIAIGQLGHLLQLVGLHPSLHWPPSVPPSGRTRPGRASPASAAPTHPPKAAPPWPHRHATRRRTRRRPRSWVQANLKVFWGKMLPNFESFDMTRCFN